MNPSAHLDHLLSFCLEQPWALTRPMLGVVAGILSRRLAGQMSDPELRAQAVAAARRPVVTSEVPTVAVLPIHGVVSPRMNLLSEVSGGTSYDKLRADLRVAVADPNVRAILLDIDSPGGSCAGATECAAALRAAGKVKPIVAQIEYVGCSAAYWMAANATEIVAAPSAQVGSIGVLSIHEDLSKMLDRLGVTISIVSAGKYKAAGAPTQPLSADDRARIQRHVDTAYGHFVSDVAKGRHVAPTEVRNGFGEGAVVGADEALALGMVDRIATLEATLARVVATPPALTAGRQPARALSAATLDTYRQQLARAAGGHLG